MKTIQQLLFFAGLGMAANAMAATVCPASPSVLQQAACPTGQHGAITQSRSAICDASTQFTWILGSWTTSANTCTTTTDKVSDVCSTSPATKQEIACPAGKTGAISQTRTATCNYSTQNSWQLGAWTTTAENCTTTRTDTPDGTSTGGTVGVGYAGRPTVAVAKPGDSTGNALAVACWQSGTNSCASVAGVAGYGVPAGFTLGTVSFVAYTGLCSGTTAGAVRSSDGPTACSCPSVPTPSTAACTSYGFDTGTVTTTIEGSVCKANYGAVLSSNTSGCSNTPKTCAAIPGDWLNLWGGNNCMAAASPGLVTSAVGAVVTLPNVQAGFTGSVTYTCGAGGNWAATGSTCVAAPVPTCPASPATTQNLSCPWGQTGTHTQTRTATCNAGTGYSWSLGSWTNSVYTCAVQADTIGGYFCTGTTRIVWYTPSGNQSIAEYNSPSCGYTPPAAQCPAYSFSHSWGAGCTGYVNVGATSVGGSYSVNADAPASGYYSWTCGAGGNWQTVGQTCTPPAPVQCGAVSSPFSWGAGCSGYINVGNTPVGGSYSVSAYSPYSGNYSWTCGAGGNWQAIGSSCNPPEPPRCPWLAGMWSWGPGNACSAYINTGQLSQGQTYSTSSSNGVPGTTNWVCGAGGSWQDGGQYCSPPPAGCPAETVSFTDPRWKYLDCGRNAGCAGQWPWIGSPSIESVYLPAASIGYEHYAWWGWHGNGLTSVYFRCTANGNVYRDVFNSF